MDDKFFEKLLELMDSGNKLYNEAISSVSELLDGMSSKLGENEYEEFKKKLFEELSNA